MIHRFVSNATTKLLLPRGPTMSGSNVRSPLTTEQRGVLFNWHAIRSDERGSPAPGWVTHLARKEPRNTLPGVAQTWKRAREVSGELLATMPDHVRASGSFSRSPGNLGSLQAR